ncbi:hypothetical protein PHJA_000446900 [Phtheirospermum japonicum]|uniref:Uncharacterized protein n=1 Tax=Phtheirospermum japonicum TaxID=374723 RepID=A0A830BD41_9LAMI|nr:hypothetical protein PHJA_000446900 [Phtheirospermum japonicum]
MLINCQRWLKTNSLLFNGYFRSNTLFKSIHNTIIKYFNFVVQLELIQKKNKY